MNEPDVPMPIHPDAPNWFRRALGVAGLVYVTAKVGVALGA